MSFKGTTKMTDRLIAVLPEDITKAYMYTCRMKDAVENNNFAVGIPLYEDYDFSVVLGVIRKAIKNNQDLRGDGEETPDYHKMKAGEPYMLVFYDTAEGELRGLLLFSLEVGTWFSSKPTRSVVEHFQLRFDKTRYSAGICDTSVNFLKQLVKDGYADRAIGGGSTTYQEQVKNTYVKAGYRMSYEFCYEKQYIHEEE